MTRAPKPDKKNKTYHTKAIPLTHKIIVRVTFQIINLKLHDISFRKSKRRKILYS